MQLSGSGANDPRWLEKIAEFPPTSLSTLEYWFGPLEVDFAGGEGMGFMLRPSTPTRGQLRLDVRYLSASFWFDMHHEDPYRARDMRLRSFSAGLAAPHATVRRLLEERHGPMREIATDKGPVLECGAWFYLRAQPDGAAHLVYETERPEWAMPAPMPDAREHLVVALFDRLVCDTTLDPIIAAIEPLVAQASADLNTINDGVVYLTFRPGLPLATVLDVFRWDIPVASSGDVHMSSWSVYPYRPGVVWSEPHVGPWFVEVALDGWPRGPGGAELPQIDRAGPSPQYDVRGCENKVFSIGVRLAR